MRDVGQRTLRCGSKPDNGETRIRHEAHDTFSRARERKTRPYRPRLIPFAASSAR